MLHWSWCQSGSYPSRWHKHNRTARNPELSRRARAGARMTSATTLDITAKDLQPGDYLIGSRSTIEWVQHAGIDVPAGKIRVKQIDRKHDRLWNRSTRMRIVRVSD